MKKRILYVFMFFAIRANCQNTPIYPETFTTFFNNPALINPSYVDEEGYIHANSGFKFRTDNFKKVSTYIFNGDLTWKNTNEAKQVVRIHFLNDNDGPYFRKPRAYLNYVYQLPLNENTSMSAGISLGGASIYVSAPSATGDGSTIVPDGALGLGLNRKNFKISISSFQIFNSVGSPIAAPTQFGRYYNGTISSLIPISPIIDLKASILYQVKPHTKNVFISALYFSLDNIIEIGAAANYPIGVTFFGNLFLDRDKERIMLSFAYNSSTLISKVSFASSMEITASFLLKNNE